jgi:hypothetical protein
MGWFDDLRTRVEELQDTNLGSTISDYIENRVVDAVVKIGPQPTGNLSAAQIAAGQRGGTAPVVATPVSAVPPSQQSQLMKYLPFVAIGLVAVLVLKRKSRG